MRRCSWAPALLLAFPFGARAQEGPATPVAPQNPTPVPSYAGNLLDSMFGLRPALAARGITLGLTDLSEGLGNATGGERQGAIFEGLAQATLDVDTGAAFGLAGGALHVSAFGIYGRGLSINNLDNLQTISSAEADRSLRLFEAWYEQSFASGKVAIRLGQQAADQEFITSQYASVFVNSSFGFPTVPAAGLPAGGPAYPLGTPAIRLKLAPDAATTVLLALFNGDPAPNGPGDPQALDGSGTNFRLDGGALVFAELQRATGQGQGELPGTYKLGAWYHSGSFPDQFEDSDGRPLAAPGTTGVPRPRLRDWSVYAVADQLLWRPANSPTAGVGAFLRAMGAPGDRNPVNVFVDGGLSWRAPFASRPNDTFGAGVGWARISDTLRRLDAELAAATHLAYAGRTGETLLEVTYQASLRPWWQLQPDFQYVFKPGGGIPDPQVPARRLGDEAVFGLRSNVTF